MAFQTCHGTRREACRSQDKGGGTIPSALARPDNRACDEFQTCGVLGPNLSGNPTNQELQTPPKENFPVMYKSEQRVPFKVSTMECWIARKAISAKRRCGLMGVSRSSPFFLISILETVVALAPLLGISLGCFHGNR